ncbi:MAG: hypothetical protein V4726_01020 [Verrucomicrobiota bacterium]
MNVHPFYFILALTVVALLVFALCAVCFHWGWREGRRRWLRNRTQQEIDLTEVLRERQLRRQGTHV